MHLNLKFGFELLKFKTKKKNKINCIILTIRKESVGQVLKGNKEIYLI